MRAWARVPDHDDDAVFCDDESALVIMGMSIALMAVALCLAWSRIEIIES